MRWLRILERRYIPNVSRTKTYIFFKIALLAPIVIPFAILQASFRWIVSKVKIKRKGKPDIVLQNIVDGWTNLILPDQVSEELALKRAAICAKCPFAQMSNGTYTIVVDNRTKNIRGMSCGKCGCPLSAKVRANNDYCPIGNW